MNSFIPERMDGESFEDYKIRRKQGKQVAKVLRYGRPPTIFVQHNPNQRKKWREEAEQIVRDAP